MSTATIRPPSKQAIAESVAQTDKPSLICCKTIIGWGSPNKQGTEATHGAALGADEVAATRKQLGWNYEPFVIPEEIRKGWDAKAKGAKREAEWQQRFNSYTGAVPRAGGRLRASSGRRAAEALERGRRQVRRRRRQGEQAARDSSDARKLR